MNAIPSLFSLSLSSVLLLLCSRLFFSYFESIGDHPTGIKISACHEIAWGSHNWIFFVTCLLWGQVKFLEKFFKNFRSAVRYELFWDFWAC